MSETFTVEHLNKAVRECQKLENPLRLILGREYWRIPAHPRSAWARMTRWQRCVTMLNRGDWRAALGALLEI